MPEYPAGYDSHGIQPHAGGVLEMHRLFIFFIHRLHTVATDTKFGCAGDFDPNVWQYNQRNANPQS